jgi:CRISPR-associated exonuclease Cas4
MGEELDDALPLRGLQHLAFCPRQWGLIHLEQGWVENRLTAEGACSTNALICRGSLGAKISARRMGLMLESRRLRLTGRADRARTEGSASRTPCSSVWSMPRSGFRSAPR